MKLEHLIHQTVVERQDSPVSQEQHTTIDQLTSLMAQSLKAVPDKIEWDYNDGSVDYIGGLFLDGKSTLFDNSGRCMIDGADDVYAYAKHEKVELLVGGYDGDYEEFFIEPQANTMVVKRAAHTIPGEDEHVVVRFKGHTFNMSRPDFEKALETFLDSSIEYERLGDRIDRSNDYDEDYPYRRPARRWHNEYPPEWDEPELDENDYKTVKSKLYGGLLYKDLQHV